MLRVSLQVWLFGYLVAIWSPTGLVNASDQKTSKNARYEIAYATYLGGDQWDQAREIIPYPDGSVLIGGMTSSSNMLTTPGVVQPKYAGDDPSLGHGGVIGGDAFLIRLSPNGTKILAAAYFGGSKQERGVYGMLLDSQGNIVIGSATRSPDMPTTEEAYQTKYGGGDSSCQTTGIPTDSMFFAP